MTDAMTPPAAPPMVTDSQAKAWQRGLERNLRRRPEIVHNGDFNAMRRLLADRERTLGLLRGLLPAVDCPWDEDGTCTEANCMKEQARVALMQAGRIPWPECSGCAVALAPGCAHAEGCEEAGRDAR